MEEAFETGGVRGVLHRPDEKAVVDGLILTHGAGTSKDAPLLVKAARAFADAGFLVLRYDLPFRQMGKTPNPKQAVKDREGVAEAAEAIRGMVSGRLFAGGHSYGGRQTAMAASERAGLAAGLLLFSYPLHPPGKPQQMRTDYFPNLRTPALFVHGTKDAFGSVEELRHAVTAIPARTDVVAVEGAGHDLKRAADLVSELIGRLLAIV